MQPAWSRIGIAAALITARDSAFQVLFKDVKNSLKVDAAVCRPSSRRVALKPAGLTLYQTVTPQLSGHLNGECPTLRKDEAKARPLAFFKWSPTRISGDLAGSCTVF